MDSLSRLRSSPDYPAFEALVAASYDLKVWGLKNAPDWETYKEIHGAITAYDELFSLIDTLIARSQQSDQHRAAESDRTKRADRLAAASRYASFWRRPTDAAP